MKITALASIIVAIGVIYMANQDYETERAYDDYACVMVDQGAWPEEYAESKEIDCKGENNE